MRPIRKSITSLVVLFAIATPLLACLWDYDTLQMERRKFPGTLELITGKFLRHSKEFYQWRIRDRQKKLETDKENLSYYDDLAVAYDKTGQHQKAIETILAKDKIKPGLYETEANLGTFYIHNGQLEKGLEHINKAIEINPDAHFGREVYQKVLVEYVLARRQDGKTKLPLRNYPLNKKLSEQDSSILSLAGFRYYLSKSELSKSEKQFSDREKAIKGISGMLRFGHYDSPILLEVLGDLLLSYGKRDGQKRMAARAYLKASYEVEDEIAQKAYRNRARSSLHLQTIHENTERTLKLEQLEATFAKELEEGKKWFEQVRADEMRWIEEGKDVDFEFTKKYYEEPQINSPSGGYYISYRRTGLIISGIVIAVLLLVAIWFVYKRKKAANTVAA